MAYHWKCNTHNEIMSERMDKTGNKIVPYCKISSVFVDREIIIKQNEESYQKDLEEFNLHNRSYMGFDFVILLYGFSAGLS